MSDMVMTGNKTFQAPPKFRHIRAMRYIEQMGFEPGIAGTESGYRNGITPALKEQAGPGNLTASRIMGIPDLGQRHSRSQIINMPPVSFFDPQMTSDPGKYATRSEGASDINVVSLPDIESSQLSDLDGPFGRTSKN